MFKPPAIRNILIPTDFSREAEIAFAHALRLTLALKADLDVLHVEGEHTPPDWSLAPLVVGMLSRWEFLDPAAGRDDVAALGIRAHRSIARGVRPEVAILEEISRSHADLVVLATHGRVGLDRWRHPSVSEAVLRLRPVPVLLIPAGCLGFVDVATGDVNLKRVLVPIDHTPNPGPGFDAAVAILKALGSEDAQIATFHVGAGHPEVELLRPAPGWKIHHWNAEGGVVDSILDVATTWTANLIVAVSEGRRNFFDELLGSTVDRLVAASRTPVLVVPADWGSRDVA